MAFINEWISPEDIEKYELHKDYEGARNPKRFVGGNYSNLEIREWLKGNQWTIDREQEVYLRRGGRGRLDDGDSGYDYFLLNWKGSRLYVAITLTDIHETNNELKIAYLLCNIVRDFLPQELPAHRAEILSFLKEALTVYGEMGMRSRYTYQLTFGF